MTKSTYELLTDMDQKQLQETVNNMNEVTIMSYLNAFKIIPSQLVFSRFISEQARRELLFAWLLQEQLNIRQSN